VPGTSQTFGPNRRRAAHRSKSLETMPSAKKSVV
jgi:hypothetical protein